MRRLEMVAGMVNGARLEMRATAMMFTERSSQPKRPGEEPNVEKLWVQRANLQKSTPENRAPGGWVCEAGGVRAVGLGGERAE